ncbi:MAG: hypothetical protein OEO23_11690 [Gemmatimonadota bacterium]|nr:hypothetical protein [Gemmatimonadota bacterium]
MSEARRFTDDEGVLWRAFAEAVPGGDYKGRYQLVLKPDSGEGEPLTLPEIRWNSLDTAKRTIRTMSDVELRRRLRSAVNRRAMTLV